MDALDKLINSTDNDREELTEAFLQADEKESQLRESAIIQRYEKNLNRLQYDSEIALAALKEHEQ